MKKAYFILALMAIACQSFAQTEKNHFLIGGSFTGSYDHHYASPDPRWQNKAWNCGLYPRAGYFIFNNFCAGLALVGSFSRTIQIRPDLPDTHQKSNLHGIGFFFRYYIRKNSNAIVTELAYSYDSNRDVYETLDDSNVYEILRVKYNGANNVYSAGLGYTRFLTDKIGLEFMVHYRYRWDHAVDGHNNFAAESYSLGVTGSIGMQFYWGCAPKTAPAN